MPIKWNITTKATKARGIMDQISTAYDGVIDAGTEHLGDVKGLAEQLGEMQADLQSAANVMGNGSGASGVTQDSPKPVPAVLQPETQKVNPAASNAQQSALAQGVAEQSKTFQG